MHNAPKVFSIYFKFCRPLTFYVVRYKELCNFIKYNYNTTSLHALTKINSNYMYAKDVDEF